MKTIKTSLFIAFVVLFASCGSKPAKELIVGAWVLESVEVVNNDEIRKEADKKITETTERIKELEAGDTPGEGEPDVQEYKDYIEIFKKDPVSIMGDGIKNVGGKHTIVFKADNTFKTNGCQCNYELAPDAKSMKTWDCYENGVWKIFELSENKFSRSYTQKGTFEVKYRVNYVRK